jgi:hypothetical protein
MIVSETRQSFLNIISTRSNHVDEVYSGEYHLLVAASSWDRRSTVICDSTNLHANIAVLFNFKKKDASGLSFESEFKLRESLKARSTELCVSEVDAADFESNWEHLLKQLLKCYQDNLGPIDVFVDLSTIPRYLSLGILGYGLKNGILRSIVFGYSEGCYSDATPSSVAQELFTEGGWRAIPIPGLWGEWEPYRERHYVVSVGFEGVKTRQFVSRSEPDKVSVLFPDPAVQVGYEAVALQCNARLVTEFSIPDSRVIRAHATDLNATLKSLSDAAIENFETDNLTYICCGTKPHSLAMAIRAAVLQEPAVLYMVPESHKVSEVKPNGNYWRYEIADASAF